MWGQAVGAKQQNSSGEAEWHRATTHNPGATGHLASPWPGSCPAIHSAPFKAALAGGSQLTYAEGAVRED